MTELPIEPADELDGDAHAREAQAFEDEPPAAAPVEGPAPAAASAETPEVAEPAAPTPEPAAAAPEVKEPFWFRNEMKAKEKENRDLRRQLEERPTQPEHRPDAEDDDLDPVVASRLRQLETTTKLDISERFARLKHGEAVDEALDWAKTRPDIAAWAMNQPDSYEALMATYSKEKLAAEIGDNPEAWRQAERERIRQEVLAEQRTPNALEPAPAPAATPARPTPHIPAPASAERSAPPNRGGPVWSGATPLNEASKNRF